MKIHDRLTIWKSGGVSGGSRVMYLARKVYFDVPGYQESNAFVIELTPGSYTASIELQCMDVARLLVHGQDKSPADRVSANINIAGVTRQPHENLIQIEYNIPVELPSKQLAKAGGIDWSNPIKKQQERGLLTVVFAHATSSGVTIGDVSKLK